MLVKTRCFGEIELGEDKIITFEHGLMGFEDYKKYTILYDLDEEKDSTIAWLQSVEEQGLAIPVINPLIAKEDYNPMVEEELLQSLGKLTDENLVILLTLTVPENVKNTTTNLKAPMIINADTRKGCQIIVENQEYSIKYNVYDAIHNRKKEQGEKPHVSPIQESK